jgi:NAD(P)-dependent dehydrogenase (short-subunit alcohol dehydrogenase family)
LTDRGVAIVTGGAFGIGLAIADALLTDGWKLILADLAQGPLDTARARLDARRTHGGGAIVNIASGPVDTAMHDDAIRAAGRYICGNLRAAAPFAGWHERTGFSSKYLE